MSVEERLTALNKLGELHGRHDARAWDLREHIQRLNATDTTPAGAESDVEPPPRA